MKPLPDAINGPVDADACAAALLEVAPAITRTFRSEIRASRGGDLSVPQFRTLAYIRRHALTSVTAIAEHLGLTLPAASRLVDILTTRGLVVREPAEDDRRRVTLQLSPAGLTLIQTAGAAARQQIAARLEPLSDDDRAAIVRAMRLLHPIFATRADRSGDPTNR